MTTNQDPRAKTLAIVEEVGDYAENQFITKQKQARDIRESSK